MLRLQIALGCTLVSVSAVAIGQTTVNSTWDGSTDNWSQTTRWDVLGGSDPYPDNNATYIYNAALPVTGTPYVVTVDAADVELLSLAVSSDAELLFDSGSSGSFYPGVLTNTGLIELRAGVLRFTGGAVTNDGTIRFDTDTNNEYMYVEADTAFSGTGTFLFQDNGTDDPRDHEIRIYTNQTLTNGSNHTIAGGAGQFYGVDDPSILINDGTVLANVADRTMDFRGYDGYYGKRHYRLHVTNNAAMSAVSGGTLQMRATFTNNGTLTVDAASQLLLDSNGPKTIGGTVNNDGLIVGSYTVTFAGAAVSGTGEYRQTSSMVTFDAASTVEFGALSIQSSGQITVADGALVTVINRYNHTLTNESYHDFNATGGLRVTGGTTAGPTDYGDFASIEIAGEDLGTDPVNHVGDPAGFVDNFHLPRLVIGPAAKVNLFDVINNDNRGGVGGIAEALYVDSLEFEDAGGILNLNGYHLYYNTLTGNASQIVDSGGGEDFINSTWICTTDDWSATACWDQLAPGDSYPDNGLDVGYDVFLPANAGTPYTVTVDVSNVELHSLDLDADAELLLNSNYFYIDLLDNAGLIELRTSSLRFTGGGVTNDGTIRFDTDTSSESMYVVYDTTLGGTGTLLFQDNGVNDPGDHRLDIYQNRTLTNGADHTIAGAAGRIHGMSSPTYFVNDGIVLANVADRTLELSAYYAWYLWVTNNNLMAVSNGATLEIEARFTNNGTLTVDSASQLNLAYIGSGSHLIGGTLNNDGLVVGSYNVTFDGTAGSGTGDYRQTSYAVTYGSGTTVAFGSLMLEGSAGITVEDGGLATVEGHYSYEMNDESDHDFNTSGTLRATGGTAAGPTDYDDFANIEIGGTDLGTDPGNHVGDPAGFVDNFHLPRLIVGPGAKVNLFDLINNGNRGGVGGAAEALYVDTLEFEDAGGLLNLNGLHLYYNTLIGNAGQIVDSGAGAGVLTSTWICGSDNWSETTCWDVLRPGDSYPDNAAGMPYDVLLPAAASPYAVTLNADYVDVLSLAVSADGELLMNARDFRPGRLTNAGLIEVRYDEMILNDEATNNGTIQFDLDTTNEDINVEFDLDLVGTGTLLFRDNGTNDPRDHQVVIRQDRTLTNGPDHTIEGGAGEIYGFSSPTYFVNDGTVLANVADRTLRITAYNGWYIWVTNNNLMAAESGGTLEIAARFTNNGTLTVDADSQLNLAYIGSGPHTIGGTLNNDGLVVGSYNVTLDATAGSGTGEYRQTSSTVTFAENTTVEFGTVSMQSSGRITVEDNGRVTVSKQYTHVLTNESYHNFNASGVLRAIGGTTGNVCDFDTIVQIEVAGSDLGDDPAGFSDNFQLPRLIIAPGAKAVVVDNVDNGNRGGVGGNDEALYVDTLEFEDAAGLLVPNDLHIYYNTLIGDPSQIGTGPDCNTNGVPDDCDIANGTSQDTNGNGIPDECEPPPLLTLYLADTCYSATETVVTVTIDLSGATEPITGGQFFMSYDYTVLDFVSIEPADAGGTDPDNPFELEIYEVVDEGAGTIDYAVGVPFGNTGTTDDMSMAVITFNAIGESCAVENLVAFRLNPPFETRLSGLATPLPVITSDLAAITLDISAPNVTPPADINVNADAGGCTATLDPGYATATDNCTAAQDIIITWVRSDGGTSLTDPYDSADSPITITWTAEDECGNTSQQVQTVTVAAYNELVANVQLSPTLFDPTPDVPGDTLERCVTFSFYTCPNTTSVKTLDAVLTFSADNDVTNGDLISPTMLLVDCGSYTCVSAEDELHTLSVWLDESGPDFGIVGGQYVADFTGDPAGGGHWLTGGDLFNDDLIDIADFGTYIAEWGATYGGVRHTDCATPLPHADINGDAAIGPGDFAFIYTNFLSYTSGGCCGGTFTRRPLTSITVGELAALGVPNARRADLNNDGVIDFDDVELFLSGTLPEDDLTGISSR
ncbi:MAG: hypothetical protein KAY37_02835 [Phycisphaerae bacterium]|nr:hypothetical protein [Phycisphaerae bacterium]